MATSAPNMLAAGTTAELYRAAIGPRGQDYYLRHFMRFDANGQAGTSWHWAAYCCTFNWLVYRKMWGWALAYVGALFGLALLIFGVGKLVLDYSDSSALVLFLGLLTAAFVVPGLYANAWFYRHCNERITTALRATREVKDACEILVAQAPGNRRFAALAGINVALLAGVLGVVNWFQETAGDPAVLARHEAPAMASAPSAQVRPAESAARTAVAPVVVASAPASSTVPAKPASAAVAAAAPPVAAASAPSAAATPVVAAADTAAAAGPRPAAETKPAAEVKAPVMVSAADRAPVVVKPEPAVLPARAPRDAARESVATPAANPVADVAQADRAAPAAATKASAPAVPRVRHVWVVQVGAYAQPENAKNALAQVQSLGLDAGAEVFDSPKGPLTRVRVGPYTRQAEAEQAALRIKSLNLPVLVIRQRP